MLFKNEQIEKEALEIIKDLVDEDENGNLCINVYLDDYYSGIGEISGSEALKILEDEERFLSILDDYYIHNGFYEYSYIAERFKEEYEKRNLPAINKEDLMTYLEETIYIDFNLEEKLLNKTVNVDMLLDFGDGNYDYTLNDYITIIDSLENDEEFDIDIYEKSSLLQFVELNGYSKDKFLEFLKGNNEKLEMTEKELKFYNALETELYNTTTSMNAMAVFVKLTVEEILKIRKNEINKVIIPKSVNAGLIDAWNGAGSVLECYTEKDIVLDTKNITIIEEGNKNYYTSNEIYGMCNDFWEELSIA